MKLYAKITLLSKIACILCMVTFYGVNAYAQQTDSIKIGFKPRTKKTSKFPDIKANLSPYKPLYSASGGSDFFNISAVNSKSSAVAPAKDKLLTVVKIYPNPVEEQLNIIISLNKETMITIKIIDLLGNEVVTLSNERLGAGEQTKTFNIPNRINPGIYFLRIVAGSESQVKRISVL